MPMRFRGAAALAGCPLRDTLRDKRHLTSAPCPAVENTIVETAESLLRHGVAAVPARV